DGAGGQETIPPRRREAVEVLQDGGTELVVVRVPALKEDQTARGVRDRARVGLFFEHGEDLARGAQAALVLAELSEDLFDGAGAGRAGRQRLQLVDADALVLAVPAEERQEGGVLEQQQPARFVILRMLPRGMDGVGE